MNLIQATAGPPPRPPVSRRPASGIAERIIRYRTLLVVLWCAGAGLGIAAALGLSGRMVGVTRLEGSESARVEDLLVERFDSPLGQPLLLVGRGFPLGGDAPALLERLEASLTRVPGVRAVSSAATTPDTLLYGAEPGSAILVVGIDRDARGDIVMPQLRDVVGAELAAVRSTAPDATLRWTGGPALTADLRATSSRHSRTAELRALPLLLIVLLVAFRSLVAALLPLLLGALATAVGLGVALGVGWFMAPSTLLGNVASILGLALGIDYSLLMITRFREALARGGTPELASVEALRSAGHTVVVSGSTVALGFAGLLLVPIAEIRSVGLGGLGVAAVAVALATTLLPPILAWLGHAIDRGRLGPPPSSEPSVFWYRLGRRVTARPGTVLILAGTPLVLLCLAALRLSPATPDAEWLPERMESARALDDLAAIGRAPLASVIPIVMELPEVAADADSRWHSVLQLSDRLASDPRVAEVRSAPALTASFGVPVSAFEGFAPDAVRRHFVAADGGLARIDVVPAGDVPAAELATLVRSIRRLSADPLFRDAAPQVGGLAAFQVDFEDAVDDAFPLVAASVIGSILLALSIGFRSILIPLKATLLNLLTVGAGLGALVLVFQHGHGSSLFGLSVPLSGVFPGVPILAFCIVFGLSMDYEVFLIARIAESRRARPGGSETDAIIEGLARTGRVISFAAILMVVVFGSFAFGEYLPAALLGFTLAVAVLADVTLVRLAIGPALLRVAGRWNWWPGGGSHRDDCAERDS
jgi:putative drug exporter of the RND superfamily